MILRRIIIGRTWGFFFFFFLFGLLRFFSGLLSKAQFCSCCWDPVFISGLWKGHSFILCHTQWANWRRATSPMGVAQWWQEFKGFSWNEDLAHKGTCGHGAYLEIRRPETTENHSEITRWPQVVLCAGRGCSSCLVWGNRQISVFRAANTPALESKLWLKVGFTEQEVLCKYSDGNNSFFLDAQMIWGFLRVSLACPVSEHGLFGHIWAFNKEHTRVHGQPDVNRRFPSIPEHSQFVLCYI